MIATVAQVFSRARALLDEPDPGTVFTDAMFIAGPWLETWDILFQAFLEYEAPRIQCIVTYRLPAGTTSVTPATALITDFGELIELEERTYGSDENYDHVDESDKLPQRTQRDVLRNFVWMGDAFYFVGATTERELRITYYSGGTAAPTVTSTSIGVDGAQTFLANCLAALAGKQKDHSEWEEVWERAVGKRYNDGDIGGDLWRLISPIVRSRQRVQIQPKPFTLARGARTTRWPFPPSSASSGGGSSMAVTTFSSVTGNLTGTINGVNDTFYIGLPASHVEVFVNGLKMASGLAYTFAANTVTFLAGYLPQTGDTVEVEATPQ